MAVRLPKNLETLRKRLQKTLPARIARAVESYDFFAEEAAPSDAKGFAAHHSACKSAMAHADMLIKIAKWTEDKKDVPEKDDEVEKLLSEARQALSCLDKNDD